MDTATGSGGATAAKPAPKPRRSISGVVLRALLLIVVGWQLAVWRSDSLAPLLPEQAAAWITPQGRDHTTLRRIAHLEDAVQELRVARGPSPRTLEALAEAAARLDALEAMVAELASAPAPAPEASAEAEAARVAADARVAALRDAVSGLRETVAELERRVDAPRPAPNRSLDVALAAKIDGLSARLAEMEQAQRAGEASAAALRRRLAEEAARGDVAPGEAAGARLAALEAAQAELETRLAALASNARGGRRAVTVALALTAVDQALVRGAPFGETLDELETALGEPAPRALAAAAETGAQTREALIAAFPDAAHAAIAATLAREAGAGETDGFGGVLARIRARVTGLPTAPEAGRDAQATLSRARHALLGGDLDGALAAAETLPRPARAAMGDWLRAARMRAEADRALADWRLSVEAAL